MRAGRLDRRNYWAIWRTPLVAPLLNGFCGDWVSGSATILFSDSCYAQLKLFNRLKTLKRAMYGRAGPNLLRARMLPLHHTN